LKEEMFPGVSILRSLEPVKLGNAVSWGGRRFGGTKIKGHFGKL